MGDAWHRPWRQTVQCARDVSDHRAPAPTGLHLASWLARGGDRERRALRSQRKGRRHDSPSDAFRPNERGRARTSRLAADSDVAASIRGGPPPRARLTLHLSFPRTAVYFLALSALNISKPSAGLRFLCTTACTALIIACGASDWKMLRPMSTPAAPCWTAL